MDEKEAELEMKKVVSPKLNALIESFDSKKKNGKKINTNTIIDKKTSISKIKKVVDNIHKKENYTKQSKQKVSKSVKAKIAELSDLKSKKNTTRAADISTKSSLVAMLDKALGNDNTANIKNKKSSDSVFKKIKTDIKNDEKNIKQKK